MARAVDRKKSLVCCRGALVDALSLRKRDHPVAIAMQDQQRGLQRRDVLFGVPSIGHFPAQRRSPRHMVARHIRDRGVGRLKDHGTRLPLFAQAAQTRGNA